MLASVCMDRDAMLGRALVELHQQIINKDIKQDCRKGVDVALANTQSYWERRGVLVLETYAGLRVGKELKL